MNTLSAGGIEPREEIPARVEDLTGQPRVAEEDEAEEKEENDNGRDREDDEKNKGKNSY